MKSPELSEALIREHSSRSSFERGEDYYRWGQVARLERRGDALQAEVEGSEDRPYRVRVVFDKLGVAEADCTCPYDWGGFCKHIVAVLLAYANEPELAAEKPSVAAMLEPLSAEGLRRALLHVLEEHPEAVPTLELHLALRAADPATARAGKGRPGLDPETIRVQVSARLEREADADLSDLLGEIDRFLAQGEASTALAMLEGVTEACAEAFADIYDWQYEGGDPFDELDLRWAEAVLSLDLSEDERDGLLTDLLAWREQLEDYGAAAFYLAEAALVQGWNDPAVRALLRGEAADTGEASYVSEDLTDIRLKVLERQGRQDEYLNLASARGRKALTLGMMVKQERLGEVMANYRTMLKTPADALGLAQTLRSALEEERALEVARFGLELSAPTSPPPEFAPFLEHPKPTRFELASWTAELAEELGQKSAALGAHTVAFKERPSLKAYLRLEDLAGPDWEKLKAELLATLELRGGYSPQAKVDIFLHEGRLERATAAVEGAGAHDDALIRRVMDAALENRADWVLAQARERAERIMDEGKSQRYEDAARWLEYARAAYDCLDQFDDWELYLGKLEAKHKRRYKLMDYLRALRS